MPRDKQTHIAKGTANETEYLWRDLRASGERKGLLARPVPRVSVKQIRQSKTGG